MDLWVVAAATGAGYLAKYWQNIARDRDGSSELSPSPSSYHDNVESPSLIHRIHGKYSNHELLHSGSGHGNQSEEMSGEKLSKDNDGNLPSSSVDPPEYRKYASIENECGYVFDNDVGEMGASFGSRRSKNTLRSRHLHLQYVKPRSSFDSCLTAHLHRENDELEQYLRSPLVSPCTTTLRPFLVTDGRRVISRVSGSFSDEVPKKIQQKNNGVAGVPALPLIGAADFSKKRQEDTSRRSSIRSASEDGNGQVLFCLGISIGIMCSIISNKLEVEKLKDSLKQSENLVQDLQEELEMKDSLTVKELVYDDDSQDTHENLCCDKRMNMFSNQMNANVVVKCADEESVTLKEVESRSKIEAELEAELERLELSMFGSTLQGPLSDDIELDHEVNDDTAPDLVHGELKADVIQRRSTSEPSPDQGTSTTSTPFSAKYGVSPRELSLRLHELIQSRLQDRITQLEEELSKTQKLVRDLESERVIPLREVSNSESSSTFGSPIVHNSPVARPLVMNLSHDALDAYNEAYYELNKLDGSHEESDKGDDEDDNDDDLILIKQIVEKARQGSPAVLRAQKAMVYLDD